MVDLSTKESKMQVYGNLMNRIAESSKMPTPEIGMGCTMTSYTDRHAGTIIAMTAKTITVQEDDAKRTDGNGMCDMGQQYDYSHNPKGAISIFRMTKRKGWRDTGHRGLLIGERDKFHDFSF